MENLPPKGEGALLVYFHGSPLPIDFMMLNAEIWLRKGVQINSIVDRSFNLYPFAENYRSFYKMTTGTREGISDLLKAGELVGVAPGGAYEALFCDSSYSVMWKSRLGFAHAALMANKPIIPVFTENIRESTLSLT